MKKFQYGLQETYCINTNNNNKNMTTKQLTFCVISFSVEQVYMKFIINSDFIRSHDLGGE